LLDLGLWTQGRVRLASGVFDPITQAESGFMSLNGFPDGEPVRTGPPIVDMATGMSACNAILLGADRPRPARPRPAGRGALIDTAVAMTGFYGMAYLISGANPGRFGNSPKRRAHRRCLSGIRWAALHGLRQRPPVPPAVVNVLDRPDLVTDPEFAHRKTGPPTRKSCAPSSPVSLPATASSTGWRR